jgi:putative transposase
VLEAVFQGFVLPKAMRTDNGVPLASPNALFGLSKLSVGWLRLGIEIERIKPGNPQQNGRHERMHLTLTLETTKPAANNFLQPQAQFDDFQHRAAAPSAEHAPSSSTIRALSASLQGLSDLDYPFRDKTGTRGDVTRMRAHLLQSPEDQSQRRLRRPERRHQTGERSHLARQFMGYDVGFFEDETCSLDNLFGRKVLPMSPE